MLYLKQNILADAVISEKDKMGMMVEAGSNCHQEPN